MKIEEIREVMEDIVARRRSLLPSPNLYSDALKVLQTHKLYLVAEMSDLQKIWSSLRNAHGNILDFYLSITSEMMLRCFEEKESYKKFCETLASHCEYTGSSFSVMDEGVLNFFPRQDIYVKLLLNNPWFVAMLLTETLMSGEMLE